MNLFFSFLMFSTLSPADNPARCNILQQFTYDIVANRLTNTQIENKYFCTQMLHRSDEYGKKARTAADFWLADFRQELLKQQVNIAEVTFPAYGDLPDETMEIIGGSQNVYAARYKGTSLRYFQLEGDKIASLLLVSQGNRGFFVTLCR